MGPLSVNFVSPWKVFTSRMKRCGSGFGKWYCIRLLSSMVVRKKRYFIIYLQYIKLELFLNIHLFSLEYFLRLILPLQHKSRLVQLPEERKHIPSMKFSKSGSFNDISVNRCGTWFSKDSLKHGTILEFCKGFPKFVRLHTTAFLVWVKLKFWFF